MDSEKNEQETAGIVFTTAQLVWLDEESGEVLEIEVVGAVPWLEELCEQGFTLTQGGDADHRRYRCRIELLPGPS